MNKIKFIFTIIIIFLFANTDTALAQNISVKSFELLGNDLTANTAGTIELDQNGEKSALIKVVTTQTGFTFDCGSIGIVKTIQKPSEIWVYVPQGARRITISHPRLGILRDYEFPIQIEKARTYELVLTTGQVQTIVQQDAGGQYLIMKVSPPSAIVKIDDIEAQVENGIVSKFLPYGKHTYSVSDPFYKDDQGIIEIGSERKELNIALSPNYGKLLLSSRPENGAKVTIDGEGKIAGITPFTTENLSKGKHNFRFQLAQYATKDTSIVVDGDGSTKDVAVSMDANFGYVNITVPDNSYIYINNENKGRSYWSGRLTEGMYFVEAKKDSYRTTSKNINIVRGQNQDVELEAPTPICGMININSHPVGASVYVDGKLIGTTPNVFNNILVGSRTITLKNKGYQDYTSNLNIDEGKVTNLDAQLKEEIKYVDLGLSVYWATCNIGADSPSDFGNFYAWGETAPKSRYAWENYKFGDSRRQSKYNRNDDFDVLRDEDDVARVENGEGWHIPTIDEWVELRDKCAWEWSIFNGVRGYMVIGPNGNSIFLPAAGYYYGNQGYKNKGVVGEYWTSSLRAADGSNAVNIKINSDERGFYASSRCCGLSVRPVLKKEQGTAIGIDDEGSSLDNDALTSINKDRYFPPSEQDDYVMESKPLEFAEQMPSFKGNVNAWLSQHIVYPAVAVENGIQGKVIVRFVVGKDGSVSQAMVTRSVDPALDREALRAVNSMPKWTPGMDKGKPVAVWFTLPVTFQLTENIDKPQNILP